ncbi:MAG: carboxypeptidase-like regulatory domain-containing protein, partial [Acidobacteriota bacterium]
MRFSAPALVIVARCILPFAFSVAQPGGPSVHGRVTDTAGRPVAGAIVSLKAASLQRQGLLSLSAHDGTYSFQPLTVGVDYELHADHEGLSSRVSALRVSNADEIVTLNLRVAPSIRFEDVTTKTGIDFILRNGATGHFYQPEIMPGGVA